MVDEARIEIPVIAPADEVAAYEARWRLNRLAKPPGSLGRLEDIAVLIAAAQGRAEPGAERARVIVFAGDHGVAAAESVSPYPPEVTRLMFDAFRAGGAAVTVLADSAGAEVEIVDVGVAGEVPEHESPAVRFVRHRAGDAPTRNLAVEDAMSREELAAALAAGVAAADRAADQGIEILAVGEIGIGNTTAAAAVAAHLLCLEPDVTVGPGTGLDARGVANKIEVVRRALARRGLSADALESMRCLGGYELAAMTGCMLGAAARRVPVVVDGYIAGVSALAAVRLRPQVRGYLLPATRSTEPGHAPVLAAAELALPVLDLGLRLGEASGAALALPIVRAACRIVSRMATLEQVLGGGGAPPAETGPR